MLVMGCVPVGSKRPTTTHHNQGKGKQKHIWVHNASSTIHKKTKRARVDYTVPTTTTHTPVRSWVRATVHKHTEIDNTIVVHTT